MKYSKSAIGLLTREYRSVLKKCLLINLGLFALGAATLATPANAVTTTPVVVSKNNQNLNTLVPDGAIEVSTENSKALASISSQGYTSSLTTDTINISSTGSGSDAVTAWWGSNLTLGGNSTESVTISAARVGMSLWDPKTTVNVNATNSINVSGATAINQNLEDDSQTPGVTGVTLNMSAKDITLTSTNGNGLYTGAYSAANISATDSMNVTSTNYDGITAWAGENYAPGQSGDSSGGKIKITTKDLTVNSSGSHPYTDSHGDEHIEKAIGVSANYGKSQIDINATGTVNITASGRAVHAGNSNTLKNVAKGDTSYVSIKADKINLKADNTGISAMSNGIVELDGDTKIEAENAIVARGRAKVEVNKSGEHTTQMDGNINFDYYKPNSGSIVDAVVDVTLSGADSYWNGNTTASWTGTPPDPTYLDIKSTTITLKDGATWTATEITDTDNGQTGTDAAGEKYAALNNLNVDNANVIVKDATRGVVVENLVAKNAGVSGAGKLNVATSADLRDGVKNDYAGKINVNNGAELYVDADADGNLDAVDGNKENIKLENVTLISALNEGKSVKTAGYNLSSGNAKKSLEAYYTNVTPDTSGNLVLGAKQAYTDLIGILQNGNYIKAYDAANADTTSVAANLKALDNQVFANAGDIATNAENIAANTNKLDGMTNDTVQASINTAVAGSVKYTDISTAELPNRKAIVLKNHDIILGTDKAGNTYNLAMLSKWDVADFGSDQIHMNLNSENGVVTLNDKHVVLTDQLLNQVVAADGNIVMTESDVKANVDGIAHKKYTFSTNPDLNAKSLTLASTETENAALTMNGTSVNSIDQVAGTAGNDVLASKATVNKVVADVNEAYNHAHNWAEYVLGVDVDADKETQLQTALNKLGAEKGGDGKGNNIAADNIAGALHELDVEKFAKASIVTTTTNNLDSTDATVYSAAKADALFATKALATTSTAGLMSAADKTKLDTNGTITTGNTNFVTGGTVYSTLQDYATTADMNTALADKVNTSDVLSTYSATTPAATKIYSAAAINAKIGNLGTHASDSETVDNTVEYALGLKADTAKLQTTTADATDGYDINAKTLKVAGVNAVTVSGNQTLTNKTIDAESNAISNLGVANLASTSVLKIADVKAEGFNPTTLDDTKLATAGAIYTAVNGVINYKQNTWGSKELGYDTATTDAPTKLAALGFAAETETVGGEQVSRLGFLQAVKQNKASIDAYKTLNDARFEDVLNPDTHAPTGEKYTVVQSIQKALNNPGQDIVADDITANSVTLGANSVSAISSDMINSTNHNATTIATTEAVYKALGKVDHLITESGDYRVFDGNQGTGMAPLSSNNVVNGHYYGNLATGTEVARDLVSLDNAVGNLNFKASDATGEGVIKTNYLNGVTTVSGALVTLDGTIKGVVDDVTLAWTKAYNWSSYVLGVNPFETRETQLQTSLNALGAAAPTGDGKGNNIAADSFAGALHELDVEKAGLATANQFTNTNDFTQGLKVSNGTVTTADGYATSTLTATADGLNISTGAKVNGALTATGDITAPNVTGTTSVITPKLTLNGKDLTASSYEANLVNVTPYNPSTDTDPKITIATGNNATVTTTKTLSDSLTSVGVYLNDVFAQKQDYLTKEFGYDTATTDAKTILAAAEYTDQTGEGKLGFADALVQLHGDDTVAGSVKNSIKTLAESATYTPDATAVNTASAGTINAAILANDKAIGNRASLGSLNAAINTGTATSVAAGMKAAGDAIGDVNFTSAKIEALRDDTNLSEAIRTLDGYLNIDTGLWNNISSLKDPDANPRTTATNVGKAIQYLGLYVDSKRLDVANDEKTATIYDDKIDSSNKATFYTTAGAEAKFYAKDEQLDGSQIASGSIAEGSLATAVVNKLTKAENSVQGIKEGGEDYITFDPTTNKLVIGEIGVDNLEDAAFGAIAENGDKLVKSGVIYSKFAEYKVKDANADEFDVSDAGELSVKEIAQSKVTGLIDALADKADSTDLAAYMKTADYTNSETVSGTTTTYLNADKFKDGSIAQAKIAGLGAAASADLAEALAETNPTDAQIATWAGTNAAKIATVGTTFDVLSKKLANVESDLLYGDNAHSIAYSLAQETIPGTTTANPLRAKVVSMIKADAVNGTYNPNGTYATDSIGAALQGKADANNVILRTAMVQTLPEKAHLVDADADRVASVTAIANALADKVNTDDVLDSVVASPATGKIYDAKTVNTALADKFDKANIVTAIGTAGEEPTASDTKVASELAVAKALALKLDAATLDAYKVKDVDADGTILLDNETGKIKVGTIGLANIKADAFGDIEDNGTTLVKSGTIYSYFQNYAKLGGAANFSSLTLGTAAAGQTLTEAKAISDGNALSLDNQPGTYGSTLATNATVVNTINAALASGDGIDGKDHTWTGNNVFEKEVKFNKGIDVAEGNVTVKKGDINVIEGKVTSKAVDTKSLTLGSTEVKWINDGKTIVTGGGSGVVLATAATVMNSAENAKFNASATEADIEALGGAKTIHNAIVNTANAVDEVNAKVGDIDFTGANNIHNTAGNAKPTLTDAVNQLDKAIGKVADITAGYAKTVTESGSSNPADIATAINNVATAAAKADGTLNFNQKFTTSDGKAVADDGSNKATNLTDAINNVAKNAAAAIENAVGDVRAEIHGDTGDHKEIKLGDKAEKVIVGSSYVDTSDSTKPETVITAGMGIDTVGREVEIAAVNANSEVGADFDAKNEKVTVSAGNKTGNTTGMKIDNKGQSITMTSSDADHITTGMEISNKSGTRTVTLGTKTKNASGEELSHYTLEIDGGQKQATIGNGTDKVTFGEGTIETTGNTTVGGNLAVKGNSTVDGVFRASEYHNTNDSFYVTTAGGVTASSVRSSEYHNANDSFYVTSGGALTASEYHNKGNSFFVTTNGEVTGSKLTSNGALNVAGKTTLSADNGMAFGDGQTVKGIDNGATPVTGNGSAETLATTATVMASAENAKFTPAEGETGVTKAATTLHDAIAALDDAMGTMVLNTENKNFVKRDDSGEIVIDETTGKPVALTNATDALNALDGVVGNVKDLDVSKGNLHVTKKDVASHLSALDARLGTIKAIDGGGKGNLAKADSDVATHFGSLDTAIGNRKAYSNTAGSNGYVATNDGSKDLTTMISEVASNIGKAGDITSTNQISAQQTVNANLSSLDAAIGNVDALSEELGATDLTSAINNLNTKVNESNSAFSKAINQLDMDQRKLRHDFEAGMAGQAALSALVPNGRAKGDTQLSIGTGAYKGHTAAAVGGFHWFTDNLLFNAGVAWDNNEATGRMGITYSW